VWIVAAILVFFQRPLRRVRCGIRPGDAVLVKASNSVGLAKLVESMAKELACST